MLMDDLSDERLRWDLDSPQNLDFNFFVII